MRSRVGRGPVRLLVLGSAAGGGLPQWNCRCPVCRLAREGDPRVLPRSQSGLAVSADGVRWVLLNASPDLRQQILASPALWPREGRRDSPIEAVVLTNAEIDHVLGLLALRERQAFAVHATGPTHAALDANPMFGALDPAIVERRTIVADEPVVVAGVALLPFAVPGKLPLYQEGPGDLAAEILGLEIHADGRRAVIVPNCARITPDLCRRLDGADLVLFDGTTYTDDELVRLELSPKTAARMGHVAMAGADGTLAQLAALRIGRRIFLHLNNTNPALVAGSAEAMAVAAAGWELASDGMELSL